MDKIQIEYIFKNSMNPDELFDTFDLALRNGIDNLEIYKPLFWNPSLSINEVCMYIKKLASTFPHISYDTYMWGARVIELSFDNVTNYDTILSFYKKASEVNPQAIEPYVKAVDAYNYDLKLVNPNSLINFIKKGINKVKDPSTLYFKLSEFFGKYGNAELKNHYLYEAEKCVKKKYYN